MTNIAAAFDKIAPVYDHLWTRSAVGLAQRAVVWRVLGELFSPGDHIVDLGCGTGEDALHLEARGVRVTAIDASAGMVRAARTRGVDAQQLAIEDLGALDGIYDGALSNFGVFNCIADPRTVASTLARLIRPGGCVVICVMGRFCFWETLRYLRRGEPHRAFRRLRGRSVWRAESRIVYPSVRELSAAFLPAFSLANWSGAGIFVPPSYVNGISAGAIERLSRIDQRVSAWPLFRAFSDHRLLVFTRD